MRVAFASPPYQGVEKRSERVEIEAEGAGRVA
jgi:hypothetical protein